MADWVRAVRSPSTSRGVVLLMFEEELSGGNTSVVVRVGDTVRRPVGPWTPAVHDLLNHLAAVGFRGAPRIRGIDELNREVLEFVSGEVATLSPADPLPWWFRGESRGVV